MLSVTVNITKENTIDMEPITKGMIVKALIILPDVVHEEEFKGFDTNTAIDSPETPITMNIIPNRKKYMEPKKDLKSLFFIIKTPYPSSIFSLLYNHTKKDKKRTLLLSKEVRFNLI